MTDHTGGIRDEGPFTDAEDPELIDEAADIIATNDAVAGETVLPSSDDDEASDGIEDAVIPDRESEDPRDADEELPASLDERQRLGSLLDRGPEYASNDLADAEEEIDLRDSDR